MSGVSLSFMRPRGESGYVDHAVGDARAHVLVVEDGEEAGALARGARR